MGLFHTPEGKQPKAGFAWATHHLRLFFSWIPDARSPRLTRSRMTKVGGASCHRLYLDFLIKPKGRAHCFNSQLLEAKR